MNTGDTGTKADDQQVPVLTEVATDGIETGTDSERPGAKLASMSLAEITDALLASDNFRQHLEQALPDIIARTIQDEVGN